MLILLSTSYNGLHLCIKGRYGYEFIHNPRRHTRPRVRQYLLDGAPRPKDRGRWVDVDWDTALNIAARGLVNARRNLAATVPRYGVLASGKFLNEENYLLNKLARQVLCTNHIDLSSHIYSASVVDGLLESAGLPAMSGTFDDVTKNAHSLLVIGSNLTEQHPVFGASIRQAILRRKIKMIVASPDFINIAEYAALPLYHQAEHRNCSAQRPDAHNPGKGLGRSRTRLSNILRVTPISKRASTSTHHRLFLRSQVYL